ncbi:hypothetical protein SLA2020_462720 [Shorea laevis]
MALFPSPLERTVASALLLLSTTPPSPPPLKLNSGGEPSRTEEKDRKSSEASLSLASIGSKSCSSYLTCDVSSREVRAQELGIIAVAVGCHDIMKLKVVKKSRSKVSWSPDNQKATIIKPEVKLSESMSTDASCLSSSSSAISSARSRHTTVAEKKQAENSEKSRKKRDGSGRLRRRAEAILKLLSGRGFSEVTIRRVLGDSPDTSKALRMLLKQEEVKRSGTGGRHDPFIYTVFMLLISLNSLLRL